MGWVGVGDGAAPALGLEAVCLEPFVTSHTSHKGLSTRMRPVPCAHPPQLPVTSGKHFLCLSPLPLSIHPLIYSAKFSVQTLCWLWGIFRPLGLPYFQSTPSLGPFSFLLVYVMLTLPHLTPSLIQDPTTQL